MTLSHGQIMRGFINLLENEKEDNVGVILSKNYKELEFSYKEILDRWDTLLKSLKDEPYETWEKQVKVNIVRLFDKTCSTILEIANLMNKFKRYEFPMFEKKTNYFDLDKFKQYISEITNFPNSPKDIIDFLKTKTQDWFAPTGTDKLRKIFYMLTQIFEEYQTIYTFLRNYSSSLNSEYFKIKWNDGTPNGSKDPVLGFRLESTRPNSPLDYDNIKTVNAKWVREFLAKLKSERSNR